MNVHQQNPRQAYSGYHLRDVPAEDAELTHVGPGTPCGEYMRRFWQPVCLSQELTDLPHAVRILGEDLVAFRDKSGDVGVLHRHCSHRGTSLEYGIVAEHGIRCCYHGWLFDIDGTILETPGETPGSRLRESFRHGAYPAREYEGLVFAYMGPPDEETEFPMFDTYFLTDNKLVPYSCHYSCSWLQVHENFVDPIHAVFLHTRLTGTQFTDAWHDLPATEFVEKDAGLYYITTRQVGDRVWVRTNHIMLPNFGQVAALWEAVEKEKFFNRASVTRWSVPIDDTNSWIFGYRHFNDVVDTAGIGKEEECGVDSVDFLGQTGNRPYEERQREPGDWDALVGQRPIAIHAKEHLGTTDRGVAMWRRILREGIRGEGRFAGKPATWGYAGDPIHTYTHDTCLDIPANGMKGAEQMAYLAGIGREVLDCIFSGDAYEGAERKGHVEKRLRDLRDRYRG